MKPFRTFHSRSWAELKDRLRDQRGYVFRGQRKASWPLATSLERILPAGLFTSRIVEDFLLKEFRAVAHNYIPAGQLPTTRLEWLARMQHHGVPTRLLDVTLSPYVAAYFAIEDADYSANSSDEDASCAVWAIDQSWTSMSFAAQLDPDAGDSADKARAAIKGWLEKEPWDKVRGVVPVWTDRRSEREAVQQALFLIPGNTFHTFMDNLRPSPLAIDVNVIDVNVIDVNVIRFDISARWRAEVLTDLRKMNISRASLFPGLDGFAQSLRYALIEEELPDVLNRELERGTAFIKENSEFVAGVMREPRGKKAE